MACAFAKYLTMCLIQPFPKTLRVARPEAGTEAFAPTVARDVRPGHRLAAPWARDLDQVLRNTEWQTVLERVCQGKLGKQRQYLATKINIYLERFLERVYQGMWATQI